MRSSFGHDALCFFVATEKKFTLIINPVPYDKVITQYSAGISQVRRQARSNYTWKYLKYLLQCKEQFSEKKIYVTITVPLLASFILAFYIFSIFLKCDILNASAFSLPA